MESLNEPVIEHRRGHSGDRREMSVAALLAAAALAWTVATAWIGFRDSVFDGLHALDRRLTVAVEALAAHIAADSARATQFSESITRRLERLERSVDGRADR